MSELESLFHLKGKTTVLTGANGKVGKVLCSILAELGSDLILVDLSEDDLIKNKHSIVSSLKVNVDIFPCNLEDQASRLSFLEHMNKHHSKIDVLINNAAFVGDSNLEGWNVPWEEQSLESWRRAIEVNLTAPFHLSQGLFKLLNNAQFPRIINISSIYGILAPDFMIYQNTTMNNPAAYGVSKAGLVQLTKYLASAMAPLIRVNSITLGGIERNQPTEFINSYTRKTLLGRMATEKDVIGAVAYLSSNASNYVTGANLIVDGGWSVL